MLRVEVTTPDCEEDECYSYEMEWYELEKFFGSLSLHHPNFIEIKILRVEDGNEVHSKPEG